MAIFIKGYISSFGNVYTKRVSNKRSHLAFLYDNFSCWDICFKNNESFEMKVEYKRKNTFVRKGPLSLSVVLQQKGQYKDHGPACSKKDNTRTFEKNYSFELKGRFFCEHYHKELFERADHFQVNWSNWELKCL